MLLIEASLGIFVLTKLMRFPSDTANTCEKNSSPVMLISRISAAPPETSASFCLPQSAVPHIPFVVVSIRRPLQLKNYFTNSLNGLVFP